MYKNPEIPEQKQHQEDFENSSVANFGRQSLVQNPETTTNSRVSLPNWKT